MPPNFWDVWADLAYHLHWPPQVIYDLTGRELRKWHYHIQHIPVERR